MTGIRSCAILCLLVSGAAAVALKRPREHINPSALAALRGSCPEGHIEWYGGGCALVVVTSIDHTALEGEAICTSHDMHLPSVHSVAESVWIRDTCKTLGWGSIILGLIPGQCQWFDGAYLDFDYMADNESCNEKVKTIAIDANKDGHWTDHEDYFNAIICTTSSGYTGTYRPSTPAASGSPQYSALPSTQYYPPSSGYSPQVSTQGYPLSTGYSQQPSTQYNVPSSSFAPGYSTPGWLTSGNPPSASPSTPIDSCGECSFDGVWLDIIFAVDSSQSMQQDGINDVQATIRTTLKHIKMERAEVRAGIIVYSDAAEVVYKLDSINSESDARLVKIPYRAQYGTNMESAIVKSMSHFDDFPNKAKARKVIVMFASGYRDGDYKSPLPMAVAFKAEGGIIVTVDYSGLSFGPVPILDDVASPGYELNRTNSIVDELRQAFCDANCFCPTRSTGYTTGSPWSCEGRCTPSGGCYRVVELAAEQDDAEDDCQEKGGNLVSVHDDDHQQFVTNLYKGRKQFWIGLNARTNSWTDGTPVDYSHWAPGQPDYKGDCVYSYQYSGLNTGWYSQKCSNALPYGCSIRPCSASNMDCKP